MRTPSYDIAALESQIGPRGATIINSANRGAVQNWLCAHGVPSERAKAMKLATLWKCYNRPKYLAAVLAHLRGGGIDPDSLIETGSGMEPALAMAEPGAALPGWQPIAEEPAGAIAATVAYHQPAPAEPIAPAAAQLATLIQSLAAGAINEQRVIELIAAHAPVPETIVREQLVIVSGQQRTALPDATRHHAFPEILACVANHVPALLVGPAGAGKTTVARQIADALGLAFGHIGAVTSRYELSGFENATGTYNRTEFRERYEHGGVFLFDEIDGSDPGALLWLNPALANGHCAFPDGMVARHPEFRFLAAANTYGRGQDRQYVGRNQLDASTLDRFAVIDFDYDERMEATAFGADDWTARVQAVRGAIASFGGAVRMIVSPRANDYGRRLLAAGMAPDRVEQITIWKGASAADRAKIETAIAGGMLT